MGRQSVNAHRNNSILFLALLCLTYYLLAFSPYNLTSPHVVHINSPENIYIEVIEGETSTVLTLRNPEDLANIANKYNIDSELANGHKVLHKDGKGAVSGRISGLKSLSLGIPIGLNSAGVEDLKALPGIGDMLAERITTYRDANAGFISIEELKRIDGIGEKKLSAVREFVSLD